MSKALSISGLVISGLVGLIFTADLAIKVPFGGQGRWMTDVVFVLCAAATAFLAWSTYREQK